MNKRKLADYTSMYEALDTLMKTELPEVELYFEIGWACLLYTSDAADD